MASLACDNVGTFTCEKTICTPSLLLTLVTSFFAIKFSLRPEYLSSSIVLGCTDFIVPVLNYPHLSVVEMIGTTYHLHVRSTKLTTCRPCPRTTIYPISQDSSLCCCIFLVSLSITVCHLPAIFLETRSNDPNHLLQSQQTWPSYYSIHILPFQQQTDHLANHCRDLSLAIHLPQLCQDRWPRVSGTTGKPLLKIILPRNMDYNWSGCWVLDSNEDQAQVAS